jgi:hypothetical protein
MLGMLIQISENSAAMTLYGSLAQVHNVGSVGGLHTGTIQTLSIKAVLRRICILPITVLLRAGKEGGYCV